VLYSCSDFSQSHRDLIHNFSNLDKKFTVPAATIDDGDLSTFSSIYILRRFFRILIRIFTSDRETRIAITISHSHASTQYSSINRSRSASIYALRVQSNTESPLIQVILR